MLLEDLEKARIENKTVKPNKIEWDIGRLTLSTNSYEKLRNFYKSLREQVIPGEPLQQEPKPTSTGLTLAIKSYGLDCGQYGWQIHETSGGLLVLEYALDNFFSQRSAKFPEDSNINGLWITLHNPASDLERRIDELAKKHVLIE